jgi:hypothetical protein
MQIGQQGLALLVAIGVGVGSAISGCGPAVGSSTDGVRPESTSAVDSAEESDAAVATPAGGEATAEPLNEAREEITMFAFATLQIQRVTLLQEGRIQRELKLTPEQIATFKQLGKEVQQLRTTLQALPPDQRREKLLTEYRPKADEYRRMVEANLDESQQRRLFQRVLQGQRGAIIFLLPGVPEALQLTDAQQDALFEIIDATRRSVDFNQLQNPIELGRIVLKANAARKQAEELLTAEQKAQWAELLGK